LRPDHQEIEKVFRRWPDELAPVSVIARQFAALVREADPFIQQHCEAVCTTCTSVCCVNRHSFSDYGDVICLSALGHPVLPDISGRGGDDPCRFLGPGGCTIERPLRPYRCTWFFCSPLMEHIMSEPAPAYRRFCNLMSRMTEKRRSLIETFDLISGSLPVWRR